MPLCRTGMFSFGLALCSFTLPAQNYQSIHLSSELQIQLSSHHLSLILLEWLNHVF